MSTQSEATNALVDARTQLKGLLPYRSTVYFTVLSRSRSGDTSYVQFLAPRNGPRIAEILNITKLVAQATGYAYGPTQASFRPALRLTAGGDTPASLIQHLGRILHGDIAKGDIRKGHATHDWLYAQDTLA
jgi:hypothetical protein